MSGLKYTTSKESYDSPKGAQSYLDFLASRDGQFFRKILFETFSRRLGANNDQYILDVACASGWLTGGLAKTHTNIEGCDGSRVLLEQARKNHPQLKFTDADLNESLPYSNAQFDTLIMSMVAHDIEDQAKTFRELNRILKPGGKFMLTIANPYYSDPVGVWKRGLLGRLLLRVPKMLVRPYHWAAQNNRGLVFNENLKKYFYTFSEHLNHLTEAGFQFVHMDELKSDADSPRFGIQHQMHRFPTILYLEFTKPA